ncbi:MAG: energy transducer TonB [Deltaproteobacteria bacterium]|nr:energy transducer TonB [Deltaproteobacteria bacterium]
MPYITVRVVNNMTTKKIFVTAVALSLAAHIVVLALASLPGDSAPEDGKNVFTVSLKRSLSRTVERHDRADKPESGPLEEIRERARGNAVDTVDLDRTDTKYYPYLLQVKERIDRQWSYPDGAFSRGEVGTTVVEFSIATGGALAACRAVVSSGHASLDAESLRAVRSAAPFAPFSEKFGLERLNIVARFRYTLAE